MDAVGLSFFWNRLGVGDVGGGDEVGLGDHEHVGEFDLIHQELHQVS